MELVFFNALIDGIVWVTTEVCTGFKGNFNDGVDKLVHMAVGLPHTCYKLAQSLLRSNKLGNHSRFWP